MTNEGLSNSFMQEKKEYLTPKSVKTSFITKASEQMKNYIADLECTLSINKTIIGELVKKHIWSLQEKRIIEKLTQENTILHKQAKQLRKERDEAQSQLLIAEQINANYKKRELELMKDIMTVKIQLTSQINRKNQSYKILEKRNEQIINILKIHAQNDKRLAELLEIFSTTQKINNKQDNSPKIDLAKDNSFLKGTVNLNQGNKSKLQITRIKTSPTLVDSEKEMLEMEANKLREKVLELYQRNLALSDQLKERDATAPEEEIDFEFFEPGNLRKWNSTMKDPQLKEETESNLDEGVPVILNKMVGIHE